VFHHEIANTGEQFAGVLVARCAFAGRWCGGRAGPDGHSGHRLDVRGRHRMWCAGTAGTACAWAATSKHRARPWGGQPQPPRPL